MKLFECGACGQPLYFESVRCQSCQRRLGFLPSSKDLTALDWKKGTWSLVGTPDQPVRFCANAEHDVCNWLVPADGSERFCAACSHNRVIPDLSRPTNLERWRRLERAKHRLVYTLLRLDLPLTSWPQDPCGLSFDFLADPNEGSSEAPTVLTGHDNGLITINIAEADDAERERRRGAMGEPYRTLLGHFRHEVGHYYWTMLVERDAGSLQRFRDVFGDERRDYGDALGVHYARGAPAGWQDRYVSAYASAHPWEDWAETWAHYLHILDTLDTAHAFGLQTRPLVSRGTEFAAAVAFDPHEVGELAAHQGLGALDLRGQLPEPQHGPAGSLPVRPDADRDQQARLRACARPPVQPLGAARRRVGQGSSRRHRRASELGCGAPLKACARSATTKRARLAFLGGRWIQPQGDASLFCAQARFIFSSPDRG